MANDKEKNWFGRHKILTVLLAIIVIAVISSALGGGSSDTGGSSDNGGSTNNTEKTYKFDDRADKQPKDVEVLPDEMATIGGINVILSNIEYKVSASEYDQADEGKTYVVADVALENTSDKTQPYNIFDFRLQTAGGQVLDGAFSTTPNTLGSGDIVTGGKVSGKIVFEAPIEDGHQYVIWKPNAFNSDRAIIQVK